MSPEPHLTITAHYQINTLSQGPKTFGSKVGCGQRLDSEQGDPLWGTGMPGLPARLRVFRCSNYYIGREFNSPSEENQKSGILYPDSSPLQCKHPIHRHLAVTVITPAWEFNCVGKEGKPNVLCSSTAGVWQQCCLLATDL